MKKVIKQERKALKKKAAKEGKHYAELSINFGKAWDYKQTSKDLKDQAKLWSGPRSNLMEPKGPYTGLGKKFKKENAMYARVESHAFDKKIKEFEKRGK